jgi:hypothetical protein
MNNFKFVIDFFKKPITENAIKQFLNENYGVFLSAMADSKYEDFISIQDWLINSPTKDFEYVYIFKGTHQNKVRFKIGKAQNIADRRKIFNVKLPFDIDLVASFRVKNPLVLESYLHKQFSYFRVGGEWFDLPDYAFSAVCSYGIKQECDDVLKELLAANQEAKNESLVNKEDYIQYLESLLVMNGVEFSREVCNGT